MGGGLERSLKPNSIEHDSDKGKRKMQNKQSGTGCKVDLQISINQSINQSTLLVHPVKMGFHIPIIIKSNMNNRNLK